MSAAERYAAEAIAAVSNQITPEKSRHLWISIAAIVSSARDAEHAAFLVMSEITGNGNTVTISDFEKIMREHLNKVREQMAFVREVLNGK